ncbi:hypothetical protein V5O48_009935 [Marasmius crinis-equi]|uniref:Uncharacterized protein n=1 Tax=Marasmius crinis-equi TaxID=585013 RepID=A0ABR3F9T5_9AGAR
MGRKASTGLNSYYNSESVWAALKVVELAGDILDTNMQERALEPLNGMAPLNGPRIVSDLTIGGRRSHHISYYNRHEVKEVLECMKACKDDEPTKYFQERRVYLGKLKEYVEPCDTLMAGDYQRQMVDANTMC